MDKTQLGRVGELALALYALVGTDGEVQLYTPVADDDHTDDTVGRRGLVPAIALQVKCTSSLDKAGEVEANAQYPAGRVREHPAFRCVVLLMASVDIKTAWLIPSPDFNALAYHQVKAGRETLEFRAHPERPDKFAPFRVPPLELGPRLLQVIDSLAQPIPRHLLGGGDVPAVRPNGYT